MTNEHLFCPIVFSLQLLGDRQKWDPTLDIGRIKAVKRNHSKNHDAKVKYASLRLFQWLSWKIWVGCKSCWYVISHFQVCTNRPGKTGDHLTADGLPLEVANNFYQFFHIPSLFGFYQMHLMTLMPSNARVRKKLKALRIFFPPLGNLKVTINNCWCLDSTSFLIWILPCRSCLISRYCISFV